MHWLIGVCAPPLHERAPSGARPSLNGAHHSLVGEDYDNGVLGGLEIQSLGTKRRW